jgi:DNA-binding transcriptional ArsR family regulator
MENKMIDEDKDLFAWAAWRKTDPETSREAAESLSTDTLTKLQRIAYFAIKDAEDGLTAHDLARVTGLEHETIGPRLRPLARVGLIHESDERRVPLGRKRAGIVWKVGPKPEVQTGD